MATLDRATMRQALLDAGVLSPQKIAEADQIYEETGQPYEEILINKKFVNEKDLTKAYAASLNLPFIDLEGKAIPRDILLRVPERIARKYQAALFGEEEGRMQLAMVDPEDFKAAEFIEKQIGGRVKIYVATPSDVAFILDQYKEGLGQEITRAIKQSEFVLEDTGEQEISADDSDISQVADAPIAKATNIIFAYAVKNRATDIHIEPRETFIQIRYRVDGILKEKMTLPRSLINPIVSRVKILSSLKIDEHRLPQDGRLKIKIAGKVFGVRVSILPTIFGEKVVMRLLEESAKAMTLEELGFLGPALETIYHAIKKPHGIMFVTGPTGSGKTTTLYSIISYLNNPAVNISTIEDPVEYRIPGVNQVQVNNIAGLDFARGLRAFLRQDPNIIMVGEIRDKDTLEIAIHAALTGHVVLTTLHTNSASTAFPRLADMGAEAFLIASTVNAVEAQRLVRKLCEHCKEPYEVTDKPLEELKKDFDIEAAVAFYNEHVGTGESGGAEKGKKKEARKKRLEQTADTVHLYKAVGCAKCEDTGYQGRQGIYEVLEATEDIQKMVLEHASGEEIQKMVIREHGMQTMQQDGFIKAMMGTTTIEEVLRVTRE